MGKIGTIYKIENTINGKVYIGQTIRNVNRRIQCHRIKLQKQYHNNNYLQNAYNKYGEKNFKVSVIETCDIKEVDEKERYWIKLYKDKGMSYNIEDGGNYTKEIAPETRIKLSQKSKESWRNPEVRRRRLKNLPRGSNNWNTREVICVTDMKIFPSMTSASIYYGIDLKVIHQNASGRNPYCFSMDKKTKLEFYYYEKGKNYKLKKHVHGQAIAVRCVTTSEKFDSITEAAKRYGLETTNISKVCKGKQKHTGRLPNGTKLSWEYA